MGILDGLLGGFGSSKSAAAGATPPASNPDQDFLKRITGIIGKPELKAGMGFGANAGASAAAMMQTDKNSEMIKALIAKMGNGQKPETVADNPTHESPVYRYSPGTMGISPADMLNRAGGSPFGFGNAFSNPFGRGPATVGAP